MAVLPVELCKPLHSNDDRHHSVLFSPSIVTRKPQINSRRIPILCSTKKPCSTNAEPNNHDESVKVGFIDYDKGKNRVKVQTRGLKKEDIPRHYRLRVEGDKTQRDLNISEVVERILKLKHWNDIENVLNHWVGRFARKNYPLLIREITKSGSLEHSVQVFCWMKNQKNYCARKDIYNMMIRLHARHNRTDQARGLFFEMQEWRCKPDAETYNALINSHGRAGQWRWAKNIMDDMLRAAIPPSRSTYNNLINACGSSGNWKEALKMCNKMTSSGVGPDLVTHNIILTALKSGAQYSKALSYFELMTGTNIRADTITLNIVIHCLVKVGQYGKAVDIFNSMREKRSECKPDIVTFTTIIHAYAVCGQIENCQATFDMMLAESLVPNIVCYNALIGAYASLGMHKEALRIFNLLKYNTGLRPDIVSYTSLVNAYGRSGQPEKAQEIFDIMKRNSCNPNLVSYNALIDAYGSQGLFLEAVDIFREMERNGVEPNIVTICTLLAASGRCGKTVKIGSILLLANSRGIKLNTSAYNSAIGSYLNQAEYDKALSLFRLMGGKKAKPDAVTFNILISGLCKMGRYVEALKFLDEMMELKIPLSKEVYSSAICAYSKQGMIAEAESMFATMKSVGCCPDVVTYTTMIHAYSSLENWENACALFEEMEVNNIEPDSIAFSSFMTCFNRGGQPDKVIDLAKVMRAKKIPFIEATFFEMISACSILRDWRTAIELVKEMEPSLPIFSLGLLNQLLHFLGKSGKVEDMMKLYYKIVASGVEISFGTYSILLRNLLAAGKWRKYLEVLQWMEEAKIQPSLEMYRKVLPYACKDDRVGVAVLIQEKIESMRNREIG